MNSLFIAHPLWRKLYIRNKKLNSDRMQTFALGIGECGRRVGLELFRMTNGNALNKVNKMHIFSLIDLSDPETQLIDVLKMGISKSDVNIFLPTTETLPSGSNLFVGRMKPILGERGVGGLWFHSKEIAEEAWDRFHGSFKYYLQEKEWYSVFHSGGGGTGCGAGPVFMEKIHEHFGKEKTALSEDLYTASIVLPNEHWQDWREANSATAIGRHSRVAHGIIIADNLQAETLVEKAALSNAFIEAFDPRDLINRRLAEVWISLQMTNMTQNEPEPKLYEAADYRRLFLSDSSAGMLIPCFREYALTDFVKGGINLKGAIFNTMKNHQLASIELKDFENVIVIVTFPSKKTTGLPGYVLKNMETYGEVADMLKRMYGEHLNPEVIYTYSDSLMNSVKITVLVKDPYVPRFSNLHNKLETIIKNQSEMTKTINKMFPRRFDRARKSQIMKGAEDEFKRAYECFSGYLCAQGYGNCEKKGEL